jgi:type II secretory pathway pseudopilin PulG
MTLVELLVVMFVLAILTGLIVGVSRYLSGASYRQQTIATQAVVMGAIRTYRQARGVWPAELDPIPAKPTDHKSWGHDMAGWLWSAVHRSRVLRDQLLDEPESAKDLSELRPSSLLALSAPQSAKNQYDPDSHWKVFADGYGNAMDYDETGSLDGRPVLISAGPDGSLKKTDDNIRSKQN